MIILYGNGIPDGARFRCGIVVNDGDGGVDGGALVVDREVEGRTVGRGDERMTNQTR